MSAIRQHERSEYWDSIYRSRDRESVSWFQRTPATSLDLVLRNGRTPASVIDVGAGASTLVDHLLGAGVPDVTLLDVSAEALQRTSDRLGHDPRVHLVVSDVTSWAPDRTFETWHDRATLHFLTDPADRAAYADVAAAAVAPGGRAVIGTFAADGPDACSGLAVRTYTADELATVLGEHFELEHTTDEIHHTPAGDEQHFVWVVMRRR
jgi:SAM-dependent methyltransferase